MERPHIQDQWSIPDDLWPAIAELIPQRKTTYGLALIPSDGLPMPQDW